MKKPTATSNLATQFPELARQWHPTRNEGVKPEQFLPKSNKKVWWQCPVSPTHEWMATITSRHKAGCPHCSDERRLTRWIDEADGTRRREVLSDQPALFAELVATDAEREALGKLYVGHTKTLTWRCSKCNQTWPNQLRKRAIEGQGCTYCSNQTTYEGNALLALHPEIALQWDSEKNALDIRLAKGPGSVNPGTHYKAWWKCSHGHSWRTEIRQRVRQGTGCPFCNPKVSKFELRLDCEVRAALGLDILRGGKIHGWEADLQIPSLNLIVEVDGFPWHSPNRFPNALERDQRKNAHFRASGYTVLRMRELRLPPIDNCATVTFKEGAEQLIACKALIAVIAAMPDVPDDVLGRAKSYQAARNYVADAEYQQLASTLHIPAAGESLAEKFPQVALQWNWELNLPLTPELVAAASHEKVWWSCMNGHDWEAAIKSRTNLGTGCSKCSGRVSSAGNSLAEGFPAVAMQWDYVKNDTIPERVTPKSSQKYGWQCEKGHRWDATVNNRTRGGQGCPYCAHKLPTPEWNLAVERPDVAEFFDLIKNTPLRAQDVMPNAGKVFWWRCQNGHEWQSSADRQARYGARCRQCQTSIARAASS
jgi:very-short-patch-repair endonuclease